MSRSRWLPAAVLTLVLSASPGCIIWGDDQVGVSAGTGIYMYVFEEPSVQIQVLYEFSGRNAANSLEFLRSQIVFGNSVIEKIKRFGYVVADFQYFFDPDNIGDFEEEVEQQMGTRNCFLLHRNPFNWWGDRHNWTSARQANPDCRTGEPWVVS